MKQTILFCIPLKSGCLSQYEAFAKETTKQPVEYRDMLKRYDIYSAKVWHKNIDHRDYVFVYHEVGSQFRERMKTWNTSSHPFDVWFRENMMKVYDIENAAGMQEPRMLVDFQV